MKNTLTLRPKDYIVFVGGLRIENVTEDSWIEFELPDKFTKGPMINSMEIVSPTKEEKE